MLALVGTYIALVLGCHGAWIPLEARMWALAYPLHLFPLAALLASVTMRTSTGERVVPHWRRRVALVLALLVGGVFAWSCGLLPLVPWHATPPRRSTRIMPRTAKRWIMVGSEDANASRRSVDEPIAL